MWHGCRNINPNRRPVSTFLGYVQHSCHDIIRSQSFDNMSFHNASLREARFPTIITEIRGALDRFSVDSVIYKCSRMNRL